MSDKISIIIPVYNREKYIRRCVESVLNQNYMNIEVILIDDGSKDNSLEICKKIATEDNRVIVIHKENGGQGSTRNIGLKRMSGDFVSFVDSDDWVEKDMYTSLLNSLKKEKADIAVCGMAYHEENGEIHEIKRSVKCTALTPVEAMTDLLRDSKVITHSPCDKLYVKEIFDGITFPENRIIGEDTAIMYQLIDRSKKIVVVPEIGYDVFCDTSSVSRRKYSSHRCDTIITFTEIVDFIEKKTEYSELVNTCVGNLVGAIFYNAGEALCTDFPEKKATIQKIQNAAKVVKDSRRKLSIKNRFLLNLIITVPELYGKMYIIKHHQARFQ